MLKIEKNHPKAVIGPLKGNAAKGTKKYPFSELDVGDSFLVTDTSLFTSVRGNAHNRGKQYGMRFSCRQTDEGLRVIRVE